MGGKFGNHGIIMAGGKLDAEQIAVGEGATANKHVSGRPMGAQDDELQKIWHHLGLLQEALRANEHEVTNAREVFASTREVADQLTRERPDRATVLSLLDRILGGVKSVTTASGLVGTLRQLIVESIVD